MHWSRCGWPPYELNRGTLPPPPHKKKKEEKEKDIMEAYIIKENVRYSNSVIHDFLYNGNYQFLDPNPSRQE